MIKRRAQSQSPAARNPRLHDVTRSAGMFEFAQKKKKQNGGQGEE
jgi:hypothetical protein